MSHRSIVQWNQWLSKDLGLRVVEAERKTLETFLSGIYGKHAVLIGVPHQYDLIKTLDMPCQLLVTPLPGHKISEIKVIDSNLYELPLASASVDLVILPHTLELVDNPRQLLTEACRIVRPQGHLIICGFNPYSLWGLSKSVMKKHSALSNMHSLKQGLLKKWLHLSDFEMLKQNTLLYALPLQSAGFLKALQFIEWLGCKSHLPCGAIYVLIARAKVIPLTPIRLRWKQSITSVRIPNSIPGPTIRNAK